MELLCEDVPEHGLSLIPPASPEYSRLSGEIERRLARPTDGALAVPEEFRTRILAEDRPTSAILVNQSERAVAALHVRWDFVNVEGRSYRHSQTMLSGRELLLPFGIPESVLRIYHYWNTILPGSKRYLGESGIVGDNTDVRPPSQDEKWPTGRGLVVGFGGGSGMSHRQPPKQITLALDGVFFTDGEFVGRDRDTFFEETVADAEAHAQVAKIALEGHKKGVAAAQILANIEKVTGPAQERWTPSGPLAPGATAESFRRVAMQRLAYQLGLQRNSPQFTDEATVLMIIRWTDAVVPKFRKT